MTLLSATHLAVTIGTRPICHDFNFVLQAGECWGILGGNGIGKTTLLQTLAGLRQPLQGEISITGKPLAQWQRKPLAQRVGILFQDSQDMFPSTVLETALTGRHPYLPFWSLEGDADLAIAVEALRQTGLESMQERQVNTLSGGERRRLAIATLLVQSPLIWLLDEPTNHLDLRHQIRMLELLGERVNSGGGGMVMVLHDVNHVLRFCTHAVLMVDAGTILCGPVREVITPESLESLYQHPVRRVRVGGEDLYYPG